MRKLCSELQARVEKAGKCNSDLLIKVFLSSIERQTIAVQHIALRYVVLRSHKTSKLVCLQRPFVAERYHIIILLQILPILI